MLKRVNESLNQKMKILMDDNRKKDGFMQKWILGKVSNEEEKLRI